MVKNVKRSLNNKIVDYKDLKFIIERFKDSIKTLSGGCFDILHYGHLVFLKKAEKIGDCLIVALESDEFILNQKGRKPFHHQDQRAEILASLEMVDLVIKLPYFNSDQDYYELVKLIKPACIAVTTGDPQFKNKQKQAKIVGGNVRVVSSVVKKLSTQKILCDCF